MPSEDGLKGSQNKTQDESLSKDSEAELGVMDEGLPGLTDEDIKNFAQKISEIDWRSENNTYMINFRKENGLSKAFCKFAGHGIRNAQQHEYIAFFESLSEDSLKKYREQEIEERLKKQFKKQSKSKRN